MPGKWKGALIMLMNYCRCGVYLRSLTSSRSPPLWVMGSKYLSVILTYLVTMRHVISKSPANGTKLLESTTQT